VEFRKNYSELGVEMIFPIQAWENGDTPEIIKFLIYSGQCFDPLVLGNGNLIQVLKDV
jgi:hypothetical protein